ncbi:30S ribosomal protein S5 [Candidatus Woesearchaeota archaeon]|nr:30S ribosomal protein S5 [Candidatus Woesearchaeota archaeon]MBT4114768.1 30S ribosomal protein S5 [Candidatus Woesearchaeota archaeon]MBT4248141.1 30S ribosomal protein S5 [Candidatus Woesearchaeota archaeon]
MRKEEEFSKLEKWVPRTALGRQVKAGDVTSIATVLESGQRILEAQIVDLLIPDLETDFIFIGQNKGKFGGGKRSIFRRTQKKSREGNKLIFSVMAVVGNKDGYVGIGVGKARETVPAREKAVRNAKLNIMQISRGCGSWQCTCGEPHSIPFKMEGREASVQVKFMPAPKGTGLVIDDEIKKIFRLAGIRDVWCKTRGQSKQKMNFVAAAMEALMHGTRQRVVACNLKYGSTH